MKLLNIVILSTYAIAAFAAFDGQGKHDDGRFYLVVLKGGRHAPMVSSIYWNQTQPMPLYLKDTTFQPN